MNSGKSGRKLSARMIAGVLTLVGISAVILVLVKPPHPTFTWLAGEEKMYSFSIDTTVNQKQSVPGMPGGETKALLTGVLNMKVFSVTPDVVRLGFQASDIHYLQAGQESPDFARLYGSFFMAEFDRHGKPLRFIVNNSVARDEEQILTALVRTFQAVVHPPFFGRTWTVEEDDANGTFTADYRVTGSHTFTKKRVKYTSVKAKAGGAASMKPDIGNSHWRIAVSNSSSWLSSAEIQEQLSFSVEGGMLGFSSGVQASLKTVPLAPDRNLDLYRTVSFDEGMKNLLTGSKKELPFWKEHERRAIAEAYANVRLEDLLMLFRGLKDDARINYDSKQALQNLLSIHPDEALRIPALLKSSAYGTSAKTALMTVLALDGSPQSQRALLMISTDRAQDQQYRIGALASFGMLESRPVTQETVTALEAFYRAQGTDINERIVANAALLALGQLSSVQAPLDDPEVRRRVEAAKGTIGMELKTVSGMEDKSRVSSIFYAAGNSRAPEFVPALRGYLGTGDSMLRSYAAEALKYMPGEAATAALKQQLAAEPDDGVKRSIMESMTERPFDSGVMAQIANDLSGRASSDLRGAMLTYLVEKRKDIPDYKERLNKVLEFETSDTNRRLIYRALYTDRYK